MTAEIQEKIKQGKPLEILLVDDEELNLETMQRFLVSFMDGIKHDFKTAYSGYAALEIIKGNGRFDLIVIDTVMPGMNGADLYAELLKIRPELCNRIIMVSSYGNGYIDDLLDKALVPKDKRPVVMDKFEFYRHPKKIVEAYLS